MGAQSVVAFQRGSRTRKMRFLGVFVAVLTASLATGLLLEEEEERAVVQGSHCDYIILSDVPKLSGCSDGFKFVIRKTRRVRSQYLVLGGKTVLAFLKTGQKFSQCKSFNNITPTIKCKGPIGGLQPDFTPGNWTGGDNSGTTSAPRVITWSFGMSEALECVRPGTSVIFEWSGSSHNVDKVGSAEDYASCSGITDTTGVSGPYTWQAPSSEGNHYFVCGIGIHCSVGNMKAAIEVSNNC